MLSLLLKYTHLSNVDVSYIILLGSFFSLFFYYTVSGRTDRQKAWDIFKLLLDTVSPGVLSVFLFFLYYGLCYVLTQYFLFIGLTQVK